MAVRRKRPKMRRTQICLMPEDYETAKRISEKRGVSLSQFVRDAVKREAEAESTVDDPLRGLIGILKDGPPDGSVNHDRYIYG